MKLSVIIPVYNEESTLAEIVRRVNEIPVDKEIVIVDDASTDNISKILQDLKIRLPGLRVFFHEQNQGKGAALRKGFSEARGDYVIVQDADLEYDPRDILKLIKPVLEHKAEVVYGSRFIGERRNLFFWHWVGNQFLTLLTNLLYNTTLSDMETCYKLIKREILQKMKLRSQRFDFEPEITAKILKQGIRIYEVPISYAGRKYSEGKKISWKDGLPAMWALIKYRFVD